MFLMSLEVQNKELQMFFEPQKQKNKVENTRRESVIFCFRAPFISNNYILIIFHSFWMISKAIDALSQNL